MIAAGETGTTAAFGCPQGEARFLFVSLRGLSGQPLKLPRPTKEFPGRAARFEAEESLPRELPQNLFPQLLSFAKNFLILKKQPVQLQRLIRRGMLAQNHVPHMHRVRQRSILS